MPELVSWLGNASYGVAGVRIEATIPITFSPTDISGLQLWMEANDASVVNANAFGTVVSWQNKGDLSGTFDLSGVADVRYGFNTVNGLNVVTFEGLSYMTSSYTMGFPDRSVFMVARRNVLDASGIILYLGTDVSGMEMGAAQDLSGNFDYVLAKNPIFVPTLVFNTATDTTGSPELLTFTCSATDISGNYAGLNGAEQPLTVSTFAEFDLSSNILYFLGNRTLVSGNPIEFTNNYDLCEMLIYDTALPADLRTTVEGYLLQKWGIPPAPQPAPPAPPLEPGTP